MTGAVIDMRVRPRVQKFLEPLGRALTRLGVTPTFVTLLGLTIGIIGAVIIGNGSLVIGGLVALAGAAVDGLDGTVARASNRVTARGAFLDAAVDRVGEIAVLAGLAISQRENARILLLVLLTMGGALLIPYMRAKAEAVGLDGRGGVMGRAERVILVTLGLITGFVEQMLWVMVVLNWFTVGQRFWATYRRIED